MSDEEIKLTRRVFLQHSAIVSASTAALCGIALKTDAMTKAAQDLRSALRTDGPSPYPYMEIPG